MLRVLSERSERKLASLFLSISPSIFNLVVATFKDLSVCIIQRSFQSDKHLPKFLKEQRMHQV
ncbi:hypothetical protein [Bartonella capreoli]|uniref:hypothetical protein n=1 Tax=Bartonella TaxID=773 RepID=UPI001ABCA3F5